MSERKLMDITHFQSECVVGYSRYAHIPISESSKLFTKYNLFEFIKQCYNKAIFFALSLRLIISQALSPFPSLYRILFSLPHTSAKYLPAYTSVLSAFRSCTNIFQQKP